MKFDHSRHVNMEVLAALLVIGPLAEASPCRYPRASMLTDLLSMSYPARTISGTRHFLLSHVPSN